MTDHIALLVSGVANGAAVSWPRTPAPTGAVSPTSDVILPLPVPVVCDRTATLGSEDQPLSALDLLAQYDTKVLPEKPAVIFGVVLTDAVVPSMTGTAASSHAGPLTPL